MSRKALIISVYSGTFKGMLSGHTKHLLFSTAPKVDLPMDVYVYSKNEDKVLGRFVLKTIDHGESQGNVFSFSYYWYISEVEKFDKPMELSQFEHDRIIVSNFEEKGWGIHSETVPLEKRFLNDWNLVSVEGE